MDSDEEGCSFSWDSWLNYDNVCESDEEKARFPPLKITKNSTPFEKKTIPGVSFHKNYFISKSEPKTIELLESFFEQVIRHDTGLFHTCKSKTCGIPNAKSLANLSVLTSVSKEKLKAWFEQKSEFFHSDLERKRSTSNSLIILEQINQNIKIIRKNIEKTKGH